MLYSELESAAMISYAATVVCAVVFVVLLVWRRGWVRGKWGTAARWMLFLMSPALVGAGMYLMHVSHEYEERITRQLAHVNTVRDGVCEIRELLSKRQWEEQLDSLPELAVPPLERLARLEAAVLIDLHKDIAARLPPPPSSSSSSSSSTQQEMAPVHDALQTFQREATILQARLQLIETISSPQSILLAAAGVEVASPSTQLGNVLEQQFEELENVLEETEKKYRRTMDRSSGIMATDEEKYLAQMSAALRRANALMEVANGGEIRGTISGVHSIPQYEIIRVTETQTYNAITNSGFTRKTRVVPLYWTIWLTTDIPMPESKNPDRMGIAQRIADYRTGPIREVRDDLWGRWGWHSNAHEIFNRFEDHEGWGNVQSIVNLVTFATTVKSISPPPTMPPPFILQVEETNASGVRPAPSVFEDPQLSMSLQRELTQSVSDAVNNYNHIASTGAIEEIRQRGEKIRISPLEAVNKHLPISKVGGERVHQYVELRMTFPRVREEIVSQAVWLQYEAERRSMADVELGGCPRPPVAPAPKPK